MARGLEDLPYHLPVQILVVSSLGLQVILFLCAGARRRETFSGVPVRVILLWLAYNFGAIFVTITLGRLSLSSSTGNHPLVTLWAPFLLLHLAGPDNIAAYALQDNQLYLRSLQTFFTQVTGGGYFLYKYRNNSGHLLWLASQLMFIVGVVKYGERWLALKRGNLGSIREYLKKHPPAMYRHVHEQDVELKDEESIVRRAHSSFHICKCGMVDYSSEIKPGSQSYMGNMNHLGNWAAAEIQLSLMYDILYTKAAVIHTWHGYTIRAISPLAILTSLLLFHYSEEDRDSTEVVDIAITYLLFGSALFMEWVSLLNALGSSWMFTTLSNTSSTWLRHNLLCSGRWDRLRRLVLSLNPLVTHGARRWSGNMGQYNILHFCTRPNSSLNRPLLGRLAELVGLEELWNRKHFSGAIRISDHDLIKVYINSHNELLYNEKLINTLGTTKHLWGRTTILAHPDEVDVEDFEVTFGVEFQEAIIIWHIGTDFFISKCKMSTGPLVDTIKALSNYMMFLLVERPYMLPGIVQNKLYDRTCEAIKGVSHQPKSIYSMLRSLFRWHDGPAAGYTSRAIDSKKHAENLYKKYVAHKNFSYDTVRLNYSAKVAKEMLEYEIIYGTTKSLEFVLEVWTDMLVYAGNRCSRESHAKKLSSGGELTTIVWLMVEHYHQALLVNRASLEEATSKEDDRV
ncbi:uncharacterized protein LOC123420797 [Hordeum vulgare subsp. vulgare]|uniref:Predicted protein n=1 Tax=Hordeum vulgare subsp. vulgare TaxID=112509 RepID=F2DWZ7_HORVV|nr:uncharacterized protein LOC123420797 [Hordeum vulgare subsp. vulgare]BAJ99618.1 predicted protein [Hordeum vulgare subsp. vulgare]